MSLRIWRLLMGVVLLADAPPGGQCALSSDVMNWRRKYNGMSFISVVWLGITRKQNTVYLECACLRSTPDLCILNHSFTHSLTHFHPFSLSSYYI